ncbi:MAG: lytic transglycosylase domain-containing protein [Ferruginibacter sp.]
MNFKVYISRFACFFILTCSWFCSSAHDIYFCGEKIPLDDKLVIDKLMNIIKNQMRYVNIAALRRNPYLPQVERWLKATNLPQDFKYLAIVESGFKKDIASDAGARGFWQLMPKTAIEWNLTVNDYVDERTDFDKSTYAACKLLANYYLYIRKNFGISSWVLTAAAYNNGIGNIKNAISKQGRNYFSMKLNPETAAYVYKIIAVKELFENPELYMKDFGYNVFNPLPPENIESFIEANNDDTGTAEFSTMKVDVNEADGQHPEELKEGTPIISEPVTQAPQGRIKYVSAKVTGKYKKIADGDLISIILEDDLQVQNRFTAKGSIIQGRAWIIDDKVLVDLGYDHKVSLLDLNENKGVPLQKLKNRERVKLKVTENLE